MAASKVGNQDYGLLEAKWRKDFRERMINLLNVAEMLYKKTENLPVSSGFRRMEGERPGFSGPKWNWEEREVKIVWM